MNVADEEGGANPMVVVKDESTGGRCARPLVHKMSCAHWDIKDVRVDTPTTMKGRTQLPADIVLKDRKIASKRVHVERVIGLAKQYKILTTKMDHQRVPYGGRIIFVCFALCNFQLRLRKGGKCSNFDIVINRLL